MRAFGVIAILVIVVSGVWLESILIPEYFRISKEADKMDECINTPHKLGDAFFYCGDEIVCGAPAKDQICPRPMPPK